MEILVLAFIVPLIGLFFRSNDTDSMENKGMSRELLEMLEEKCKRTAHRTSDFCIICIQDYTEKEKVILMPCDSRHYFHEK